MRTQSASGMCRARSTGAPSRLAVTLPCPMLASGEAAANEAARRRASSVMLPVPSRSVRPCVKWLKSPEIYWVRI